LIPQIYFEKSGERVGPFSIQSVIEKLSIGDVSLTDSSFCEGISEIWTPLQVILFELFPEGNRTRIFLSPGNGKTEGPFTLQNCLLKANFEENFWKRYLAYNNDKKDWQIFSDFISDHIVPNEQIDVIDPIDVEPEEEGDVEGIFVTKEDLIETTDSVVPSEIKVLDRMIAESSEFKELSASLSGFNLWDLFHLNTLELQNERMLLWLLKENKSHNLGDFFLRRWLILILHNDRLNNNAIQRSLNPLNIEYARVVESKIISQKKISINNKARRLDLFIDLKTLRQDDWVIIIEIKVDSYDSPNQLKDYRQWLNEKYPDHKKLTIFLYDENLPQDLPSKEDPYWLKTTFSDIRKVIKEALKEKKGLVPLRERSFIEQYLENLPPLAPEGKAENLDELTHSIFGKYSRGVQYVIDASLTNQNNLNSWQRHALFFAEERKKEFSLLKIQNERKFLHKQLAYDLLSQDWFPESSRIEDIIVFNAYDYGIDLVELMINSEAEWRDSISSTHLAVFIQLYYGSYHGNSCFRLRIRVPEQPGFEEQRNILINDFFGQINPSNYGGNQGTSQTTGLIYNKVLSYEKDPDLFVLSRTIIKSFHEIWSEDENFNMAMGAILSANESS